MVGKEDKSLVAWYRCEQNPSNTLYDELGVHDMTTSGTSIVSGGSFSDGKNAIFCSGSNPATVTPTGNLLFTSTDAFTFACWIKVSSYPTSSNEACIFSFRSGALRGMGMDLRESEYSVQFRDDSNIDTIQINHNDATEWVHLCVSSNGTKAYLYVNGVLEGSVTIVTSTDSPTDFNLGGNRIITGNATDFDGAIDDVRVYNRFLTEAEAKYIMHGRGFA